MVTLLSNSNTIRDRPSSHSISATSHGIKQKDQGSVSWLVVRFVESGTETKLSKGGIGLSSGRED